MSNRGLPPHDPEKAAYFHDRLYQRLEQVFEEDAGSARLGYDGLLWVIKAGQTRLVAPHSSVAFDVVLRRGYHVPELYRVEAFRNGTRATGYEYSRIGGFMLTGSLPDNLPVYMGQYIAMHKLVDSVTVDDNRTRWYADAITRSHYQRHPEEPFDELLIVQDAADHSLRPNQQLREAS